MNDDTRNYIMNSYYGWGKPNSVSFNASLPYKCFEKRNAAILAYAKMKGYKAYRCKFFSGDKEYVYFGLDKYCNNSEAIVECPNGDFKVVQVLEEATPDVTANFEYKFLIQPVVVDTPKLENANKNINKILDGINNNAKIEKNNEVLEKYGVNDLVYEEKQRKEKL